MTNMTFYLWKLDASTGFMPAPAGQVTVEGDRIEVDPSSDAKVRDLAETLGSRPSLPLRAEAMQGQGEGMTLQMRQLEVGRGETDWGYALSEAIAREGGYTVSFTPEPV
jgi:hypothetical protein